MKNIYVFIILCAKVSISSGLDFNSHDGGGGGVVCGRQEIDFFAILQFFLYE